MFLFKLLHSIEMQVTLLFIACVIMAGLYTRFIWRPYVVKIRSTLDLRRAEYNRIQDDMYSKYNGNTTGFPPEILHQLSKLHREIDELERVLTARLEHRKRR